MNSCNNINNEYKKRYIDLQKKYKQMERKNMDLFANLNTINYYNYIKHGNIFNKFKFFNDRIDFIFKEKIAKISKKNDKMISILFFVHTWREFTSKKSTAIGGTTNYVIDLVNHYKHKAHLYIITVINGRYMLVDIRDKKEIVYDLGVNVKVKNFEQYDEDFYWRVKSVINELQIDLIHINHVIDFPADLALIASEYRTITSIHDYTFLCPKFFMLDTNNKICSTPCYNNCSKCLDVISEEEYNLRNQSIKSILFDSEKVIFPNITVVDKFKLFYEIKKDVVIEHGILTSKFNLLENYNHKYNLDKINIAFVGSVDEHKGGKIVKDVINNSPNNIKYHLFGFSNDKFFENNTSKFTNHGKYSKFDLPYLLQKNNIDLVLFLNQVEESFSYALSEVALSGIPSLAFDIGAIGNRIKNNKLGWVIPITDNPSKIVDKIIDIFTEGDYYDVKEGIKKYHFLTNDEYADIIFKYYISEYIPRTKDIYHHYRFLRQFWVYTIF